MLDWYVNLAKLSQTAPKAVSLSQLLIAENSHGTNISYFKICFSL